MTPEDKQASLFAEWLEAAPGTPAPEGLDPDVVAAAYALSPERAPRPAVSLEDILGGVTVGPFAKAEAGQLASDASGAVLAAAEPVVKRRDPARRATATAERAAARSRAWWAIPGVGVALTAMAAGLIAIKVGSGLVWDSPEAERFAAPATSPAEPMAPGAGAPSETVAIPEMDEGKAARRADTAAAAISKRPASSKPMNAPAPVEAPLMREEAAPAPMSEVLPPEPRAGAAQEREKQENTAPKAAAGPSPVVTSAPAPPAPSTTSNTASRVSSKTSSSKDAPAQSAPSPAGQAAGRAELDDKKRDQLAADAAPAAAKPSSGASTPFDYNPSFYVAYPEVSTAYAAAVAAESGGRYTEALSAFAGLLTNARADVAQDAAWHAGRCLRSLGRFDDALRTIQSGLQRSSANTPYRSNLYNLQGEIQSAQGKTADAQKSWTEAARLNASR